MKPVSVKGHMPMAVGTKHRFMFAWHLTVTTEELLTFAVHWLQTVWADPGRLIPESICLAPVLRRIIARIGLNSRGSHLDSLRQVKLPVDGVGIEL
jgi:hypothetical protein